MAGHGNERVVQNLVTAGSERDPVDDVAVDVGELLRGQPGAKGEHLLMQRLPRIRTRAQGEQQGRRGSRLVDQATADADQEVERRQVRDGHRRTVSRARWPVYRARIEGLRVPGEHHAGEQTWRRISSSSSVLPAPIATELRGSSARNTGKPVSSRSSASKPLKRAPPPVSTIPRSAMSPASSGGVRSSVPFTASTMALTGSARASRTSSELTVSVRGPPATRSRPLISIVTTSSFG